jgi:hypothetical protein
VSNREPEFTPSPEEIREECRRIQSEWTEEEEARRRGADPQAPGWSVPVVGPDPQVPVENADALR